MSTQKCAVGYPTTYGRKLRILILEDRRAQYEDIKKIVERITGRCDCVNARSTQEARELLEQAARTVRYDLFLIDSMIIPAVSLDEPVAPSAAAEFHKRRYKYAGVIFLLETKHLISLGAKRVRVLSNVLTESDLLEYAAEHTRRSAGRNQGGAGGNSGGAGGNSGGTGSAPGSRLPSGLLISKRGPELEDRLRDALS
jgi:hypothetical protein